MFHNATERLLGNYGRDLPNKHLIKWWWGNLRGSRYHKNSSCAICVPVVFGFNLLYRGLTIRKIMYFTVFEPLTRLCGLLMKTMPILYLFSTVHINKVVLLINLYFFRLFYKTNIILKVSSCYRQCLWYLLARLTLINLFSSGGWGKLRGK